MVSVGKIAQPLNVRVGVQAVLVLEELLDVLALELELEVELALELELDVELELDAELEELLSPEPPPQPTKVKAPSVLSARRRDSSASALNRFIISFAPMLVACCGYHGQSA